MKKMVLVVASIFLLLSFLAPCYGGDRSYASFGAGIIRPTDSDQIVNNETISYQHKDGVGFTAALGQRFGNLLRGEAELSYLQFDLDKACNKNRKAALNGEFSAFSFLANGYFDFVDENSPVIPFLTAGVGCARVNVTDVDIAVPVDMKIKGDHELVFAYQIGGGVGLTVDEQTVVDLKFRYFATEDPEFKLGKTEFSSHSVYVGVRYLFESY